MEKAGGARCFERIQGGSLSIYEITILWKSLYLYGEKWILPLSLSFEITPSSCVPDKIVILKGMSVRKLSREITFEELKSATEKKLRSGSMTKIFQELINCIFGSHAVWLKNSRISSRDSSKNEKKLKKFF